MADERMSEEEIARWEERETARLKMAEACDDIGVAAMIQHKLDLLAELRRERARADVAEARLDAFARAVVLAATGIAQPHASLAFLLEGLPREVAGSRALADEVRAVRDIVGAIDDEMTFDAVRAVVHERNQLRRDRERERDIAAKREREACVAYLRRCASDANDISYRLLADEIERGEHHG